MNNLYLITEKYPNNLETNDYYYVVIAKNQEEAIKLCDIDLPNEHNFEVLKKTDLLPELLLEVQICSSCGDSRLLEISYGFKPYKDVIKSLEIYNPKINDLFLLKEFLIKKIKG